MNTYTILIVDDEENILKSLARTLRKGGYRVFTAQSAKEGLLKLEDVEVDLVISDQRMPGMHGIDFLKKVKVEYPQTLTIMLTAYSEIETALQAINDAGVYKFIPKPWNNEELMQTVKRALELKGTDSEKDSLLEKVKAQDVIMKDLEREYPGITKVHRDKDGSVCSEY